MRNFVITATLIISAPDEMTDQQAFAEVNKNTQPFGVDFIYPANAARDLPAVVVRILRSEPPVHGMGNPPSFGSA